LKTGLVIWVSGTYPGSIHDLTIARTKVINILQNDEIALANKAYIGDFHFLTSFNPIITKIQNIYNRLHASHQSIIERTNSKIKHFCIFFTKFRVNFHQHSYLFLLTCQIINIEIKSKIY
jgi:hypothetical protein